MPVRFRDIIRPEHYEKFRWQFFRVHFQFVMANELPNAYDFFMIVCGPVPLSARMAVPDAALDVATGDSGVRDRAWKRIEAATTAAAKCRRFEQNGTIRPPQRLKNQDFSDPAPRNRIGAPGWLWRPLWCKGLRFYGLGRAACRLTFRRQQALQIAKETEPGRVSKLLT